MKSAAPRRRGHATGGAHFTLLPTHALHPLRSLHLAGVVILASGCARTGNHQASDSALTATPVPATPKGPTNNAAGQLDDYNARTSGTDTGAALGTTNDTIAQRGAPQPSDTTHKRP